MLRLNITQFFIPVPPIVTLPLALMVSVKVPPLIRVPNACKGPIAKPVNGSNISILTDILLENSPPSAISNSLPGGSMM
ncbi:unnamed protein product, partial [Rotaria socialis]